MTLIPKSAFPRDKHFNVVLLILSAMIGNIVVSVLVIEVYVLVSCRNMSWCGGYYGLLG